MQTQVDRRVTISCDRYIWANLEKPSSADLFREATDLAVLGFIRASCCLSRLSLQLGLADVCVARQAFPAHPVTGAKVTMRSLEYAPRVAAMLFAAELVSEEFIQEVSRAAAAGNRAAHGRSIEPSDAFRILEMVRRTHRLAEIARPTQPIIIPNAA